MTDNDGRPKVTLPGGDQLEGQAAWDRIAELNRHAAREVAAKDVVQQAALPATANFRVAGNGGADARRLIRGPELRRAHDAQAAAQLRRDLAARVLDDKVGEVSKAALDLTEAEEALDAAKAASAKLERDRPAVLGVVP